MWPLVNVIKTNIPVCKMQRYNILICIQLENKRKKSFIFFFCEKCEIEKLNASQLKKS